MKKEDLIELKKSISTLSKEDKKIRNKYLKGLMIGKIFGPITGYSSIDKPWLKYYTNSQLELDVPEMSINNYMEEQTKEYDDLIAFEYFGKQITYKEFKNKRDKVLKSLISLNIKKGDIVSVCLPNIPEVGYVFYAINKLGAIANMLDPRTNKATLTLNVNDAQSDLLITLDSVTEKFLDTKVKKIIPISPVNTIPKVLQKIIKMKDKSMNVKLPLDNRIITYDKFIENGNNIEIEDNYGYEKQSAAVIAYTGGTTGVPKGVIVTNEAFNAMIVENSVNGYNVNEKDSCINIAPPWTYYGMSNCFNAYLCMGVRSILIPQLGPDDLGKLISKYKPNHVITVPSALIAVMNDKKLNKSDLEYLKTIIVGADKLDPSFELEFDKFLEEHHASTKVTKGYGMTEVCAAATYTKGETNIPGTVGIPFIFENLAIFDVNDPYSECQTGQRGEIAIKGPKNMIGYFGENKNETSTVLKVHHDGTVWAHAGDIGHIDTDGKLYIDGRLKRMFVRKGFKIFPGEIETQILKNPNVLQSAVVGIDDLSNGYITRAYIVMKNAKDINTNEIIKEIEEQLKSSLYDYELPDEMITIDKLPLTGMNKIDYTALQEMDKRNKVLSLKRN